MAVPAAGPRLLVGVDPAKNPSDPLRLAGKLTRRTGLPVVLVTVIPRHPLLSGREDEQQRAIRDDARERLIELGRSFDGLVVEDALAVARSSPARALHELGESAPTALIVVGSTTRGAVRRVLPGSVAQQLLSGAGCPVAVAPHGYGEQEGRELTSVGVALDGSVESAQALAAARGLARRAGLRLRIITVVERLAFGHVPAATASSAGSANRIVEEELRRVHEAALAAGRDDEDVEGVLRTGNTIEVLLEQSQEVDLLVAGSRGYGPLGAVLLGSTTRELTQAAGCPMIVIPRDRSLDLGDDTPPRA
jgi:nucleotide-binding universal stress UspA family protein